MREEGIKKFKAYVKVLMECGYSYPCAVRKAAKCY